MEISDISRRAGTLVVFGVPVIVGGGIVYAIMGSLIPVFVWVILLYILAGALITR